jgi:transposase
MLAASVRILLCTVPQDMRRSFDALALVTRELLGEDPQSGALYIFLGKRPTRVKVLWWDKSGYVLLYKRLHRALFRIPVGAPNGAALHLDAAAFNELLAGVANEKKERKRCSKVLTSIVH